MSAPHERTVLRATPGKTRVAAHRRSSSQSERPTEQCPACWALSRVGRRCPDHEVDGQ